MSDETDDGGGNGGPAGAVLAIAFLDLLLLATALRAFSLGALGSGAAILALAGALTGIDLWLYRRGSL